MRAVQSAVLVALALAATMMLVPLSSALSAAAASPSSAGPHGSASVPGFASSAASSAAAMAQRSRGEALEQKILATTKADHIPFQAASLPNLLGSPVTLSNGVVTPNQVTPAPFGIGTYGVRNTTGTPQAFSLETQSWQGSITLNSDNTFLLDNDGALSTNGAQNEFGVQLNAVTVNTTVGGSSNYSFWTQNVLYFNFPEPGTITFLDNVWNFSSPAVNLAPGTLYSYNGSPVYPEY